MNPNRKRSFIHKANRKRRHESDIDRKARIADILRRRFGLPCIFSGGIFLRDRKTNETMLDYHDVYIPNLGNPKLWENYEINLVDIWIKSADPQRIIELDGGKHVDLAEHDRKRNTNYAMGNFTVKDGTLIILDESQQDLPEDDLVPILEKKLQLHAID